MFSNSNSIFLLCGYFFLILLAHGTTAVAALASSFIGSYSFYKSGGGYKVIFITSLSHFLSFLFLFFILLLVTSCPSSGYDRNNYCFFSYFLSIISLSFSSSIYFSFLFLSSIFFPFSFFLILFSQLMSQQRLR